MTIQTISSSWTAAWPVCLTVSRCLTVSSDMVSRTNNKSDPRPDLAICPLQCTDRHRLRHRHGGHEVTSSKLLVAILLYRVKIGFV